MISDRLKDVILKELGLDKCDLRDDTMAVQVPGWDSLSHVRIISAIEKEYNIRFSMAEIMRVQNLGDLQKYVDKKTLK